MVNLHTAIVYPLFMRFQDCLAPLLFVQRALDCMVNAALTKTNEHETILSGLYSSLCCIVKT